VEIWTQLFQKPMSTISTANMFFKLKSGTQVTARHNIVSSWRKDKLSTVEQLPALNVN
jgi:hypothetical protein